MIEIKEIKVRPNIDENDYQVKMRAMKSFIEEGDKVKVTLRFRGREMAHQDIGIKVLERIRAELEPATKVEQMPRMENRQMIMVLVAALSRQGGRRRGYGRIRAGHTAATIAAMMRRGFGYA